MNKFLVGLSVAVLVCMSAICFAGDSWFVQDQNYQYTGKTVFDVQSILNIGGTWQIGGTAVTATAAQLNAAAATATTSATSLTSGNLPLARTTNIFTTAVITNVVGSATNLYTVVVRTGN